MLAYCKLQFSETVRNLIVGSEKHNRQLRFQFNSSHDSEKCSKLKRVVYSGTIIGEDWICPDPAKDKAMVELPQLANKDVRTLMGTVASF